MSRSARGPKPRVLASSLATAQGSFESFGAVGRRFLIWSGTLQRVERHASRPGIQFRRLQGQASTLAPSWPADGVVMKGHPEFGISTLAVHAGETRYNEYSAITTPIVQASTFIFRNAAEIRRLTSGDKDRFEYGRYGHPTQYAAEGKLAAIERAEDAVLFSSGMSALTTTLYALLRTGDHVIITDDAYKRTLDFCRTCLPRFGIKCTVVKMGDYRAIERAATRKTRVFMSESPTNPYLNIMDLERLTQIFRGFRRDRHLRFHLRHSVQPTAPGVRCGSGHPQCDQIPRGTQRSHGGRRSRSQRADRTDPRVLEDHRRGHRSSLELSVDPGPENLRAAHEAAKPERTGSGRVPGSASSGPSRLLSGLGQPPHHAIAVRQMRGFGGVVSFELEEDTDYVHRFLGHLKLVRIGPSLGGPESLITHPASISYYRCTRDERLKLGIKDGLVRLAVGIEDTRDIIQDIEQALTRVSGPKSRSHRAYGKQARSTRRPTVSRDQRRRLPSDAQRMDPREG